MPDFLFSDFPFKKNKIRHRFVLLIPPSVLSSIMILRAAEWLSRNAAVRLKVEWVSSLACPAHRFKWSLIHGIISRFNKLINMIWQLVSSALGRVKAQLTIPFKSLFYYHADKGLHGLREGDDCSLKQPLWYSRSATPKVTLNTEGASWVRIITLLLQDSYCEDLTTVTLIKHG